jgi:para-nitrobenzyl esterase
MPVMVWIPGGGNFEGGIAAGRPYDDGESLARHGVVVVSLNYRLGTFGFFSHPALTRESPHHASGNQGILDQIAALKWVRENIATFGGDPHSVTIFGQSAGSVDATFLMATPLSKGLFERVIAESGSVVRPGLNANDFPVLREAESSGEKLAARWNPPRAERPEFRLDPPDPNLECDCWPVHSSRFRPQSGTARWQRAFDSECPSVRRPRWS